MPPEQEIKRALKRYIESIGGYWVLVQGGAYSKPGDPDIIACVRGRFVGIESKTATGVLSPVQRTRAKQISEAGGIHVIARNTEQLESALRDAGLLRKPLSNPYGMFFYPIRVLPTIGFK